MTTDDAVLYLIQAVEALRPMLSYVDDEADNAIAHQALDAVKSVAVSIEEGRELG